jgi:Cu/Zn superoxide dismutase
MKLFFSLDTLHGPRTANIMNRHVGDLGNISTDASGTVNINMEDIIIQLYNATQSIINRTAVVHLFRDDGGQGGFSDSTTTGYDSKYILINLIC